MDNMIVNFIIERAKEPSTYAGLAAIAASFGLHFSDTDINAIIQVLISMAGLASVLLKENHPTV